MSEHKFTDENYLKLHQLVIHKFIHDQSIVHEVKPETQKRKDRIIKLYDWQKNAMNAWQENDFKGIVKVVTGGGKTIFALSAISKINDTKSDLRIIILVPTIILMEQWTDVISNQYPQYKGRIGRRGGGNKDNPKNNTVMVYVIPSARKFMKKDLLIWKDKSILLISDECHHLSSEKNKLLLQLPFNYTLGLSATPEKTQSPSMDKGLSENMISGLGKLIFSYNYLQAIRDGIIPKFRMINIGYKLEADKNYEYKTIAKSIIETRDKISEIIGRPIMDYVEIKKLTKARNKALSSLARTYDFLLNQRRELLYLDSRRLEILFKLVNENNSDKIILFHERKSEARKIFMTLFKENYKVILDDSDMKPSDRKISLDLFKNDIANILVSVKTLIEGFNAPKADLGVIVASTSSVRQRIQTMGRILRKSKDKSDPRIYTIFIKDTVDERIFKNHDWNKEIGTSNVEFLLYSAGQFSEAENIKYSFIEEDYPNLKTNDDYPGNYFGDQYSIDVKGNIFKWDNDHKFQVRIDDEITEKLRSFFSNGGGFKITPEYHHIITKTRNDNNEEVIKYISRLTKNIENIDQYSSKGENLVVIRKDNKTYVCRKTISFDTKNKTKIKREEILPATGKEIPKILKGIQEYEKQNTRKIRSVEYLKEEKVIVYREKGKITKIASLDDKLEFRRAEVNE